MTLTTTEELKHLASSDNANELTRRLARECLANREAQPVLYASQETLAYAKEGEKSLVTWSEPMGDAVIPLFTAPTAPAYPERLPCPVHLLPGLKFGKGVPTRSMLDALVRRAEYESELEAMTPEQMAENDARLEKLKALIPQPSVPAMPGIITASMAAEKAFQLGAVLNSAEAEQFAEGWNACRTAMLAQPVSGGYKLVPAEATEDMIAAAMNCDDVSFNADETFCVNFGNIYAAMLAAAPEGGNDHDTRR